MKLFRCSHTYICDRKDTLKIFDKYIERLVDMLQYMLAIAEGDGNLPKVSGVCPPLHG